MKRNRIVLSVLLGVAGLAQAATWTGATNDWLSTTAWDTGNIPNGVGEYAAFGNSAENNVNISSPVVLGRSSGTSLGVSGTGSYTFSGAGTLSIERLTSSAFANDMYFNTTGDTVFDVPVVSSRSADGGPPIRFRADAGSVQFNQLLSWSSTSLQLHHSSATGSIEVNGGMMASTANKELWLWTAQPVGISINSTIASSVSSSRITVANGAGTVRLSNPSGVAADSSLERFGFNGGTAELGENNQIATSVALVANVGTLDLNGHSNSNSAALALLATTTEKTLTVDFSDAAAEALYFSDSSAQNWATGNLLNLVGFVFGLDELRFGAGPNGLTPTQLSKIRVDGLVVDDLGLDDDGFLVVDSTPPVLATWTGSTNSWMSSNAWDTAIVPNAVGDGVVFGDSGEYSVEIDSAVVLGRTDEATFSVEGAGSYTYSGAGSLMIKRGTANQFVNGDLYLTTSGDTIFNVPLAVTRTGASPTPTRIRTDSAGGDVTFNQPITWDSTSLQIRNDSASATMAFNGAMTGSSINQQLWVSVGPGGTIAFNNLISATTNNIRITIASGDGIIRMGNPSGAVVDSSIDFLSFIGGHVELESDNQIASDITLVNVGGSLDLNGYSNSNADRLTLASAGGNATFVVDFSDAAAESLQFSDSSAVVWGVSDRLNLSGIVFGSDSVRFGTDANGLTATQLGQILIDGAEVVGLKLDHDGFLALPSVGTIESEVVSDGTGMALTWENTEGVSFSVLTNIDLVHGDWGVLQSNLTGVGSSVSYTGSISAAETFFRIIQD